MIRLPTDVNSRWTQPNNSDKFGSLWYTKNCNLDEEGYIKLSPRSVKIMDEAANADFGVPVAIGQFSQGEFQVGTTSNANFNADIDTGNFTFTENDGTAEPTMTTDSHAKFFHNRWFATTDTAIASKAANGASGATWTLSGVTFANSGVRHYIEVFASRDQICFSDKNILKQYTDSSGTLTNTTNLTIPSDFEIVGLAYNNTRMGIITRFGTASNQVKEAMFFVWGGATTAADAGLGVGSDACIAVAPYKSSWAILTRSGRLLYYNGGGFDELGALPFYFVDKHWGAVTDFQSFGDILHVEGDIIYINIGQQLNSFGRKMMTTLPNTPSGVWCFDPKVGGPYHRYSPSISQLYRVTVSSGGTNTGTDVMTAATGTIPATGNIARYVRTDGTGVTGLTVNQDYYIIKVSSTTFKLATSKANALAGTAIDLTAADSSTSYFHMYDLVDYGATYFEDSGAITTFGETTAIYQDVIFGGSFLTTALAENPALCMTVPFLENRGYFVTPKIFSSEVKDVQKPFVLKFRPLKSTDSIVVKCRKEDVEGLPTSGASAKCANWTTPSEFYTSQDLSEALTYFNNGGKLEVELISGAGAGQCVQVTDLDGGSGAYSLALEDEVLGASAGLKSDFIIHNWEKLTTLTSDSDTALQIPVGGNSKFVQYKIELRGSDVTIEECGVNNEPIQLIN